MVKSIAAAQCGSALPVDKIFEQERSNYLTKLREVVAKFLQQSQESSSIEKQGIDSLKKTYKVTTSQSANSQMVGSTTGLLFSVATIGVMSVAGESMQKPIEMGSNSVSQLIRSFTEARSTQLNGVSSLAMNELQTRNNQMQSQQGNKSEVTGILTEAERSLKESARNG